MGFYPDNKIILAVNVDANGILGKMARIKALNEELTNEINSLKEMLSINEEAPSTY